MMKKTLLLLLVFTTFLTISCSSDDNGNTDNETTFMSAEIDGIAIDYDTVAYSLSSDETEYSITGSVGGSSDNLIQFIIPKDQTGINGNFLTSLIYDGTAYSAIFNSVTTTTFTINITTNNDDRIEGTFSGEVIIASDPDVSKQVTNGRFLIIR